MEQRYDRVTVLGVILCKYCNQEIDTVDTNGVRIFYGECEQESCKQQREFGGDVYE
ncbi:MAG TPA: GapA-binding peptide SR1P [Bacilli bacterium]